MIKCGKFQGHNAYAFVDTDAPDEEEFFTSCLCVIDASPLFSFIQTDVNDPKVRLFKFRALLNFAFMRLHQSGFAELEPIEFMLALISACQDIVAASEKRAEADTRLLQRREEERKRKKR